MIHKKLESPNDAKARMKMKMINLPVQVGFKLITLWKRTNKDI